MGKVSFVINFPKFSSPVALMFAGEDFEGES